MRTPDKSQEFSESVIIALLNTGRLFGGVFRHSDAAGKALPEAIIVQAAQPVPQLSGTRGYRVDNTILLRSPKSATLSFIYGECMQRIMSASAWRSAALSAGMTMADDLDVLDEEISGDRNDGPQLRKRTIIVPILINKL